MTANPFETIAFTARITELLIGAATLTSAFEMLVRQNQLADNGILAWPVLRTRNRWLQKSQFIDCIFRYPNVLGLVCGRLIAALVLFYPCGDRLGGVAVALIFICNSLLMMRSSIGNDGADQMTVVVLAGLMGTHVCGAIGGEFSLWFIALQSCLSYSTSGIAKLCSREWRDGSGLLGVMKTEVFGLPKLTLALDSQMWLVVASSWGVFLFETLYVVVLMLPFSALVGLLGVSALFHIVAARIMGLNNFTLAFASTYPALCHCWTRLHSNA